MKHLYKQTLPLLLSIVLSGCVHTQHPSTQQNTTEEKITKKQIKKDGYLQRNLDSWLQSDWNPTVKNVEKRYNPDENKSSFTLQEYVDKAVAYSKEHPTDESQAHYKKLESLPAIGK